MNFLQAIGFLPVHPVEEDRPADNEQIIRLQSDIKQLKARLEKLEVQFALEQVQKKLY